MNLHSLGALTASHHVEVHANLKQDPFSFRKLKKHIPVSLKNISHSSSRKSVTYCSALIMTLFMVGDQLPPL